MGTFGQLVWKLHGHTYCTWNCCDKKSHLNDPPSSSERTFEAISFSKTSRFCVANYYPAGNIGSFQEIFFSGPAEKSMPPWWYKNEKKGLFLKVWPKKSLKTLASFKVQGWCWINHRFHFNFFTLLTKNAAADNIGETYPFEENVHPPGTAAPHPWRGALEAAKGGGRKSEAEDWTGGKMAVGWYNPLYGRVVSSPYSTTNQGLICSTKFNICFPWSLGVGDLQRERIVFRFPTSTFQWRTGFIDWVSDLPTMSRFFVSRLNLGNGDPLPYCQMRIFENYV